MQFGLSTVQLEAQQRTRAFGEQQIAPTVIERDQGCRWNNDLFCRMGHAGLLGVLSPRDHGGAALTAFDTCLVMEGFGYGSGDAGLALAWAAHMILCGVPIARLGSPEQCRRYIPAMCSGDSIGAFAGAEPAAGGEPTRIRTRAEHRDGRWILNGEKTWVINAPVAHHFLVLAATDPEAGIEGLSAFVVSRDAPGFHAGPAIVTTGMRTACIGTITFDRCEVPESALLGLERGGMAVLRLVQRWERTLLLAPWLGIMQAAAERTHCLVRDSRELGRPLGDLPSTRVAIADMAIRSELTRRMIYRAAVELDISKGDGRSAALAHFFLVDRARETVRDALQLHGIEGLNSGVHVERWYRDAMVLPMLGDRSALLRSVVAGALLELG